MTLALGLVSRAAHGGDPAANQLIVMADSRLTIRADRYLDNYLKAVTLGPRSAAVAAGSAMPFGLAVEAARPFIAWTAARRAREKMSSMSVLCEANTVFFHLNLLFDEFDRAFIEADANEVHIIVTGFFSDNTPGLVRVVRRNERGVGLTVRREISVWRPRPGARAYVVVGDQSYVPILSEAVRRSAPPQGRSFHDIGSVLWDIIKHQGDPASSVGGGLAFGFIQADNPLFQWPLISIEGDLFCRALKYPLMAPGPYVQLNYNPSLFAQLEREHIATPFAPIVLPDVSYADTMSTSGKTQAFSATGDPRLVACTEDDWLIRELDEFAVMQAT